MAERSIEFAFRNIELHKSDSLGSGSYGRVCKAKCDGLLCAAKIMHPTLFDSHNPGMASYLQKFKQECHLLSSARHPNIVQYLATCYDPDTHLPVLLMELCDESLTAFLERSPGPLSYHIQLNICHDIALALVYLHSNGLIHRDLTGNNVLMIAGTRAKVTDFGMSKFATVNQHMTLCPGNILYMSPEALDEAKLYTAKLDIFSLGVIIIQILTRQFPKPTERFRTVDVPAFDEPLKQVIPDTERRQAHLQLISDSHPLKPLAIQCLRKKESERPSALQLSERLCALKQSPLYTESVYLTETTSVMQDFRYQLRAQKILSTMTEDDECRARSVEIQGVVEESLQKMEALYRQLQGKELIIEMNDRKVSENQHIVDTKERELQQTKEQLRASAQLVSELQHSISQKDKIISDLQRTISTHIQQLVQQDKASRAQPQQLQRVKYATPTATGPPVSVDTRKMIWREGNKAPEEMQRGAAVVHGNTAFFRPVNSQKIYSYQNILGKEQWTRLPDNPYKGFSLAVIDGLLTSVGGVMGRYKNTSSLLSLMGEGARKQWCEIFPPMPTPRQIVACITTDQALVVAGGYACDFLDTVEVMNISTKQWSTVSSLPRKDSNISAIACGDTLYLAQGYIGFKSNTVLTCSLTDLLQPATLGIRIRRTFQGKHNVWKEIRSLPVSHSTLASFGGHVLAIGGCDDSGKTSANVYRYDSLTNSWNVISQMKNKRSHCFGVALPDGRLLVVGGSSKLREVTDSVETWGQ